jgi:hypothetical protein
VTLHSLPPYASSASPLDSAMVRIPKEERVRETELHLAGAFGCKRTAHLLSGGDWVLHVLRKLFGCDISSVCISKSRPSRAVIDAMEADPHR